MSLFPRFFASEFTPLVRLIDELSTPVFTRTATSSVARPRPFAPRFDVREGKDSYQIEGELPGVDRSNLNIEFTDPHTLSIHGRTAQSSSRGTPQVIEASQHAQSPSTTASAESADTTPTVSYQKPSVEDAQPSAEADTVTKPAEPVVAESCAKQVAPTPARQDASPYRYWVLERSVGEFHRHFSFPSRVDQDAVKAGLKNGILSIVVPKATAPTHRRIQVE